MVIVSVPTTVQLVPFEDAEAVKVFPVRSSLSQYGAATAGPAVRVVAPPVSLRRWNVRPCPGVRATKALAEFAAMLSRIMIPAFAQAFVYGSDATRTIIDVSLEIGCRM